MSQSHRQFVCKALFPDGLPPIYECPLEHGMPGDIEDANANALEPAEFGYTVDDLFDGFAALSELFVRCVAQNQELRRRVSSAAKASDDLEDALEDVIEATPTKLDDAVDMFRENLNDIPIDLEAHVSSAKRARYAWDERSRLHREDKTVRGNLRIEMDQSQTQKPAETRPSMERNFTSTTGKPGQLGCPFASRVPGPSSDAKPALLHNLPTPRSSRSNVEDGERAPKRTSFDRASRARTGKSSAASATGSGPGCPIRYMDQHSPEEIAKYFEDHKHELPRSHELCVKRFQDNSASIRELDAKYGNLVSMIQGLGQKHQPMLPGNADMEHVDREGLAEEDEKNVTRVERWAKAVSESIPDAEQGNDIGDTLNANAGSDEEQRETRFDRTLKDVRVGESPSRPWGVSIPAKYLDRVSSSKSIVSCESSSVRELRLAKEGDAAPNQSTNQSQPESRRQPVSRGRSPGKCPFGHKALNEHKQEQTDKQMNPKANSLRKTETRQPDSDIAPHPADDNNEVTQHTRTYEIGLQSSPREEDQQRRESGNRPRRRLVNRGLMIVARYDQLEGNVEVINEGDMIAGYAAANVPKILDARIFRGKGS